MRIRDGSSDVCSSDLQNGDANERSALHLRGREEMRRIARHARRLRRGGRRLHGDGRRGDDGTRRRPVIVEACATRQQRHETEEKKRPEAHTNSMTGGRERDRSQGATLPFRIRTGQTWTLETNLATRSEEHTSELQSLM